MAKAVVKRISSSGKRASEVSQKGLAEAPHTPVQGDLFSLDSPLRGGVRAERAVANGHGNRASDRGPSQLKSPAITAEGPSLSLSHIYIYIYTY